MFSSSGFDEDEQDDDIAGFQTGFAGSAKDNVKCVVVGDGLVQYSLSIFSSFLPPPLPSFVSDGVGKTTFLQSYFCPYRVDIVPTVFDNYASTLVFDSRVWTVNGWDTVGGYPDRLRALSYPETDIFLFMFSLVDQLSLLSLRKKFYPEVVKFWGSDPIIVLVGTKKDILVQTDREEEEEEGKAVNGNVNVAKAMVDLKAYAYFECSASTMEGMKGTFECVCRLKSFLDHERNMSGRRQQRRKRLRPILQYRKKQWRWARKALASKDNVSRNRASLEVLESAREFCQSYVQSGLLSADIVLHILHNFVQIDLHRDVPVFRTDLLWSEEILNRESDEIDVIRMMSYGRVGDSSRQIFCHFRIRCEIDLKYLPLHFQSIEFGNKVPTAGRSVLCRSPSAFYSEESTSWTRCTVWWTSRAFGFARRNCGTVRVLRIVMTSARRFEYCNRLPEILCSDFSGVVALSLADSRELSLLPSLFDATILLPSLRLLELSGCLMPRYLVGSDSYPLLATIRISECRLEGKHIIRMASLSSLESVLFRSVNLSGCDEELWRFFRERKGTLEEFVVFRCPMHSSCTREWDIRIVEKLRVLVVISCEETHSRSPVKFPESFVDMVEAHLVSSRVDSRSSSRQFLRLKREKRLRFLAVDGKIDGEPYFDGGVLDSDKKLLLHVLRSHSGGWISNLAEAERSELLRDYETDCKMFVS